MNKTIVVHKNQMPYDIYIGRPSKWGNPFTHKSVDSTMAKYQCATRQEAIDKFKQWLLHGDGQYLLPDLSELKGKMLGCWCHPLPCHGDILAELANNLT